MEKKYIKFNSFVNFRQSKKNFNRKNTEERIINIYKKEYFFSKLTKYKKFSPIPFHRRSSDSLKKAN